MLLFYFEGNFGKSNWLEPFAKDFPQYGEGGATQAITNAEITAQRIVDMKSGKIMFGGN